MSERRHKLSIDSIVERNYDRLKDPSCVQHVVQYITLHPSLEHRTVIFIKQITKVANHILLDHGEQIRGYSVRLCSYAEQGLEHIAKGKADSLAKDRREKLESHLYSYLGNFNKAAFKETNDPKYAMCAYEAWGEAATRSEKTEPKFSIVQAREAARLAEEMSKTQSKEHYAWLERAYNAREFAARTGTDVDPERAGHDYYFAAEHAKALAQATNKKDWWANAAMCYSSFIELTQKKKTETRKLKRLADKITESGQVEFCEWQSRTD